MKHSFSAFKMRAQCHRQYYDTKVLKRFPYVQSPEGLEGDKQHDAFEDFIAKATPLPAHYAHHTPWLTALRALPGEHFAERKLACDGTGAPTTWFNASTVLLGQADYTRVHGAQATVLDWKSQVGRSKLKYADTDQLEVMAMLTMAAVPAVQTVNTALVFHNMGETIKRGYTRADMPRMHAKWVVLEVAKSETVIARADRTPTPSNLCPWCPVRDCEHNPGPPPKKDSP